MPILDLATHRITVTGGRGFLGSRLVHKLRTDHRCPQVFVADLPEFDLRNPTDIGRMYDEHRPDIVIHLDAVVGGIGANMASPGRFFYDNAIMGLQLMHEAHLRRLEKFVALGTICCYPKHAPVPFREDSLWDGYPEETNAPYGLAKKMLLVQAQAYRQEYGFNAVFLMPVNLYGPGDNFDPRTSHVIPALIRKCVEAKQRGDDRITVWGSGRATREFLFVDDAADGIILATQAYDKGDPVNLGAGFEISIRELAETIARLTCFRGTIAWDPTKPDGQPRRMLDTSRARESFGFEAKTSLEQGLSWTIRWFQNQMAG